MDICLTENTTHMPGTILEDTTHFFRFIQEEKIEITGNKGLLPNYCLPKLNERMSHPLQLQLKREQQRSYPHINGLYLLARTLGLIQIIHEKSKRYLIVNEIALKKWSEYNPVEQYFNLMQVWFFYADVALINQDSHSIHSVIFDVYRFTKERLMTELIFKDEKDQMNQLYWIKLYNLALLEMFGIVNIEDLNGITGKSWLISKISLTTFGKKIMAHCIGDSLIFTFDTQACMKKFYQKTHSIFPSWEKYWEPEQKITNQGTHFFKVSLTKKIWCRIRIHGAACLDILAACILDAFNFDYDHLYRFRYVDRFGVIRDINHEHLDDGPYADEFKVGDLDILQGDTIEFLYDFGDCWKFNLQLEKIDAELIKEPIMMEMVGEAPEQYQYYEDV